MRPNKPLIRLASAIHQALAKSQKQLPLPVLPQAAWRDAERWLWYLRFG